MGSSPDVLRSRQPPAHRADRRRGARQRRGSTLTAADGNRFARVPGAGGRADRGRDRRCCPTSAACIPTTRSWPCGSPRRASTRSRSTASAGPPAPTRRGDDVRATCRTSRQTTWGGIPADIARGGGGASAPTVIGGRGAVHDRLLHGRAAGVPDRRRWASGSPGVIGFYGWPTGSVAQRRAGAGRRGGRDRGRPCSACSAAPTAGITARRDRRVRRGADGGRRRPPARSATRARRTASSTARRPSSRMPARRRGPRCSRSSGRGSGAPPRSGQGRR